MLKTKRTTFRKPPGYFAANGYRRDHASRTGFERHRPATTNHSTGISIFWIPAFGQYTRCRPSSILRGPVFSCGRRLHPARLMCFGELSETLPTTRLIHRSCSALNPHAFVFIRAHLIGAPVVQLCGARRGMVRHRWRVFQRAGAFQVIGDAGHPQAMIADFGFDADRAGR